MEKRVLAVLVLGTLLLSLLTGCFGTSSTESGTPTITTNLTYFGYKADAINLYAIEDTIRSFKSKHPEVSIRYEGIKGSTYYEKLYLRANSGNLDDLFMVDHDSVRQLEKDGFLEDLSDIVDVGKFIPAVADQFVNEDGSIYFVPTAIISFGFYCNMDLLRAHGFQKAPTNFTELGEMCDYFVGQGITPIVANNYTTVRTLVLAKGMYPVYRQEDSADTIAGINSGEIDMAELLRPGVEMVHQMFRDGWMDGEEAARTKPTSGDLDLFKAGDRPFMITGTWASPRISGEGGVDFEYSIYPYPIMENGSVLVLDIATCMSVNAKGENKEVAKEYVKHMIDPDVIWAYCDSQSSFTPIVGDLRLPEDGAMQPQIEYLSNGQNVISSNFNIDLPLNSALESVGLTIMNGGSIEEAMTVLSEKLAN